MPTLRDLMLEDLRKSGLSRRNVTKMQCNAMTGKQVAVALNNRALGFDAYTLPYFDLAGKLTGFVRYRYLEKAEIDVSHGFNDSAKRQIRYMQQIDSGCHLYFAPLIDWQAIAKETTQCIYITEGEKKAACACVNNIACIGLGGVWNFRDNIDDVKVMLSEFDLIDWRQRKVVICYDNDLATNEQVQLAERTLAQALLLRYGANVYLKRIPKNKKKMGIDDYIVKFGVGKFLALPQQAVAESKKLHNVNNRFALITSLGRYIDYRADSFLMPTTAQHQLDVHTRSSTFVDFTNYIKPKEVSVAATWLKWKGVKRFDSMCFAPGKGKEVGGELNMWKGWGVKPEKGDVKPFVNLFRYVTQNASKDDRNYFWRWLAYPIQNPGAKICVGALIWSVMQGTGKSFIGLIIKEIYGKNATKILYTDLDSAFNDWGANKQFIISDEVVGRDKREHTSLLKDLLTRETILVNKKYVPTYEVKDCANFYFTSNYPDAIYLEDNDRRFFIVNAPEQKMPAELIKEVNAWRRGGGASYLMHHLLHNVDCSAFDPWAAAPVTAAKMSMTYASKSELERWVADLKAYPRQIINEAGVDVCKTFYDVKELIWLYDPRGVKRVSVKAFTNALQRAGFKPLQCSRPRSSERLTLWCVGEAPAGEWSRDKIVRNYDSVSLLPDRARRLH